MKIRVTWKKISVSDFNVSEAIKEMSEAGRVNLTYREGNMYFPDAFEYEAKDLLVGQCPGNAIREAMKSRYKIDTELTVDGKDMTSFAANQEAMVIYLTSIIGEAIVELKKTRNWLRDKRIADIRRLLEGRIQTPNELLKLLEGEMDKRFSESDW